MTKFKSPKTNWMLLENNYVLTPIEKISVELILDVIEKYDVKSYDDFTCPYHRKLAEELNLFDNEN